VLREARESVQPKQRSIARPRGTDARLAGMRTSEGASPSDRPKLARANSNANLPRFSQRELCWAPEGSHTGQWCVADSLRGGGHEIRVSIQRWVEGASMPSAYQA
jgi:hypothetical protein